jgi:hypothetical protein
MCRWIAAWLVGTAPVRRDPARYYFWLGAEAEAL